MSKMKRFVESVSVDMGFNGEINDKVMAEGHRLLRAARIREALDRLGLQVMHFPSRGLLAYEISQMIGDNVGIDEVEAALMEPQEQSNEDE